MQRPCPRAAGPRRRSRAQDALDGCGGTAAGFRTEKTLSARGAAEDPRRLHVERYLPPACRGMAEAKPERKARRHA
jgi:hypothetical protein